MIYPDHFESKIGFDAVRLQLSQYCFSPMGKERVADMAFTDDADRITISYARVREYRRMIGENEDLAVDYFFDVREPVARLRIAGTHLEEGDLFDLKRSLETVDVLIRAVRSRHDETDGGDDAGGPAPYPHLEALTEGMMPFAPAGQGHRWRS